MLRQIASVSRFLKPSTLNVVVENFSKSFSIFTSTISQQQAIISSSFSSANNALTSTSTILQPTTLSLQFDRGMKQVGKCKRRCKDCYFVVRQDRFYVMCKTHPRHKQMAIKKKLKYTWTLTDATQSPQRAW